MPGCHVEFDASCSTELCLPEANLHEVIREVARLVGIANADQVLITGIERLQNSV